MSWSIRRTISVDSKRLNCGLLIYLNTREKPNFMINVGIYYGYYLSTCFAIRIVKPGLDNDFFLFVLSFLTKSNQVDSLYKS